MLLVLHYLYSDDIPAFWDRRVGSLVGEQLALEGYTIPTLKDEVKHLARILRLEPLNDILILSSQRSPKPSMSHHLGTLFDEAQNELASKAIHRGFRYPLVHDVLLELSDHKVACHSAILRARSPLFASFLDDEEWTAQRWVGGLLVADFKHLSWRPMSFVFKYLYENQEEAMFDSISKLSLLDGEYLLHSLIFCHPDFTDTVDEYLDFVFAVLSCSVSGTMRCM
jgi:hypothetical protein